MTLKKYNSVSMLTSVFYILIANLCFYIFLWHFWFIYEWEFAYSFNCFCNFWAGVHTKREVDILVIYVIMSSSMAACSLNI